MSVEIAEYWEGAVDPFRQDEGVRVTGGVDTGFAESQDGLRDAFVVGFVEFHEKMEERWSGGQYDALFSCGLEEGRCEHPE